MRSDARRTEAGCNRRKRSFIFPRRTTKSWVSAVGVARTVLGGATAVDGNCSTVAVPEFVACEVVVIGTVVCVAETNDVPLTVADGC